MAHSPLVIVGRGDGVKAKAEIAAAFRGDLAGLTQGCHLYCRDVVHEQGEGTVLGTERHGRPVLKEDAFKQVGGLVKGCPVLPYGIQVDAVLVPAFTAKDGAQL